MKHKKPTLSKKHAEVRTDAATGNEALFGRYIANKPVLIADVSAQARAGISRLLRDLGARQENVFLAATYNEAVQIIHEHRPELVISDYHLADQIGLKLIHHQKRQILEPDQGLFILVTADSTEAAIAEAAEEEVDSFILKPFTITTFRQHLVGAALAKLRPDPYRQLLQSAKLELAVGNHKEAIEILNRAAKLNAQPILAQYYLGRAYLLAQQREKAEAAFKRGLTYNPIHYRCLSGLFDLLVESGKRDQAYAVGQKLIEVFPITAQRLEELTTLAIQNRIFTDTEHFLKLYLEMEYRTPELAKCLGAALVVTGKHFLEKKKKPEALGYFEKAIGASGRSGAIIQKVILALLEVGDLASAEKFLKAFPSDTHHTVDYLTADFLILNETAALDRILAQGRRILKKGVTDPKIYEILIQRAVQAKLKRSAEVLAYEAAALWPDQKSHFLKLAEEI